MREIAEKLISRRCAILEKHPFYGRILMHLPFALEECRTAYTNGKKIAFDPKFIKDMRDAELDFLILHEVLHCVLGHCTRGGGRLGILYNVACDIVVNSLLCETFGTPFSLNGREVMHKAPDGREGRKYTAEQVYDMLVHGEGIGLDAISCIDEHNWDEARADGAAGAVWAERIKGAARACGAGNLPLNIKRQVERVCSEPKIAWREVLCNFIKNDRADFDFSRPDRRFQDADFLMPAFMEDMYSGSVQNLWFAVDTSGSVSDRQLGEVMKEIRCAVSSVDGLSGLISFFDAGISKPVPFECDEDVANAEVVGGGGTDFGCVFQSMDEFFHGEMPRAVIIMTDGYAPFPDERVARGIPVLWIIVNTKVTPPWGEVIHIHDD